MSALPRTPQTFVPPQSPSSAPAAPAQPRLTSQDVMVGGVAIGMVGLGVYGLTKLRTKMPKAVRDLTSFRNVLNLGLFAGSALFLHSFGDELAIF